MPRGCVIYIHASLCLLAIGVSSCTNGNFGRIVVLYTYRRGVRRCSFRRQGQFQEPQIVKRATVQDFTSFLCLHLSNINLTVAVVLFRVIMG